MKTLNTRFTLLLGLGAAAMALGLWLRCTPFLQSWKAYRVILSQMQEAESAYDILQEKRAYLKKLDTLVQYYKVLKPIDLAVYLEDLCRVNEVIITVLPWETQTAGTDLIQGHLHFALQGGFKGLVKVLYQLELSGQVGTLTHLRLEKQVFRHNRRQLEVLHAKVELSYLIQNQPNLP